MRLTSRDRKIVMLLIPAALVAAYWILLLSPKRDEQASLQNQLTQAEGARQIAAQRVSQLSAAKQSFTKDYATVLSLGKSIPDTLDMPSLLLQLDASAAGTDIHFTQIQAGQRNAPPSGASSSSNTTASGSSSGMPGLDSVPLSFQFTGSFFHLADFFHQLKRFVQVANGNLLVSGRLITINSLTFSTTTYPALTAAVSATVYLAPKAQGTTAGATPAGPNTAAGGSPAVAPASQTSTPSTPATPAAVTIR